MTEVQWAVVQKHSGTKIQKGIFNAEEQKYRGRVEFWLDFPRGAQSSEGGVVDIGAQKKPSLEHWAFGNPIFHHRHHFIIWSNAFEDACTFLWNENSKQLKDLSMLNISYVCTKLAARLVSEICIKVCCDILGHRAPAPSWALKAWSTTSRVKTQPKTYPPEIQSRPIIITNLL